MEQSIDATDFTQVLYFVCAITKEFDTLKERTRGIDVFKNFKEKFCEKSLNITNIVSICTDGVASMTGKREGFVAHLKKELNQTILISFHCILHQQNLGVKSVIFDDTLKKGCGHSELYPSKCYEALPVSTYAHVR